MNTDEKILREKTNLLNSIDRIQSNQQENDLSNTLQRSLTNYQLMRTSKLVNYIHQTNNHRRHLTRAKSVRSRSKSSNRIKSNEPLKTSEIFISSM